MSIPWAHIYLFVFQLFGYKGILIVIGMSCYISGGCNIYKCHQGDIKMEN